MLEVSDIFIHVDVSGSYFNFGIFIGSIMHNDAGIHTSGPGPACMLLDLCKSSLCYANTHCMYKLGATMMSRLVAVEIVSSF